MDVLKNVLKKANELGCTVEMLHEGEVSYLDIIDQMPYNKMHKRGRKLIKKYGLDPMLAHKCITIYMADKGDVDYEYKDVYPDANIFMAQMGNVIREYHREIRNTKKLYQLVKNVNKEDIPRYKTDAVTVTYKLADKLSLPSLFDRMEYPMDIIMEVTRGKGIRRKISVKFPPKDIPRRYMKPSLVTRPSYISVRFHGKDITIYEESIMLVRNRDERIDIDELSKDIIGCDILSKTEMNTKVYFPCTYKVWHRRIMAYIATHFMPFSEVMRTVREVDFHTIPYTGPERELLSVRITLIGTKCTFKNRIVVVSDAKNDDDIIASVTIVTKLMDLYNKVFNDVYKFLSGSAPDITDGSVNIGAVINSKHSKIDHLRSQLPELFVRNYTRECHCLPVMLTDDEAKKCKRLVIKYPIDGKYARWYTSPSDDLYVGLKINRLSNRSLFKYIVVCYTSNHMINPSKRTYQYYNNVDKPTTGKHKRDIKTLKTLDVGRQGPIPRTMEAEYGVYNYKRLGTGGSFVGCLEHALGITIRVEDLDGKYNVLRQELWNATDDLIHEQIHGSLHTLDGAVYYRLFEEVYRCNIIIVEINNSGKYSLSIPSHKSYYIWEPVYEYNRYIIILKNRRKLYQDTSISHELVISSDGKCIFTSDDDLVSKLVHTKSACTLAPTLPEGGDIIHRPKKQYIDENGKCTLVITKDGRLLECGNRPYSCPVMSRDKMLTKCSLLYKHMLSTNDGNKKWLSTTSDYLFFPNDDSFQCWMDL